MKRIYFKYGAIIALMIYLASKILVGFESVYYNYLLGVAIFFLIIYSFKKAQYEKK